MVGDLDEHKISSVQNFRFLGAVEASKSYNGIVREGHFVCCLELLRN